MIRKRQFIKNSVTPISETGLDFTFVALVSHSMVYLGYHIENLCFNLKTLKHKKLLPYMSPCHGYPSQASDSSCQEGGVEGRREEEHEEEEESMKRRCRRIGKSCF